MKSLDTLDSVTLLRQYCEAYKFNLILKSVGDFTKQELVGKHLLLGKFGTLDQLYDAVEQMHSLDYTNLIVYTSLVKPGAEVYDWQTCRDLYPVRSAIDTYKKDVYGQ